jgi:hypothetical protein
MGVVTLEDRRVGPLVASLTFPDWLGMEDCVGVGWLYMLTLIWYLVVVVEVSEQIVVLELDVTVVVV